MPVLMKKEDRESLYKAEQLINKHYQVLPQEMHTKSREQRIAHARFMVWCILNLACEWSLPKIGDTFDRDHTTVLAGIKASIESGLAKEALELWRKK